MISCGYVFIFTCVDQLRCILPFYLVMIMVYIPFCKWQCTEGYTLLFLISLEAYVSHLFHTSFSHRFVGINSNISTVVHIFNLIKEKVYYCVFVILKVVKVCACLTYHNVHLVLIRWKIQAFGFINLNLNLNSLSVETPYVDS